MKDNYTLIGILIGGLILIYFMGQRFYTSDKPDVSNNLKKYVNSKIDKKHFLLISKLSDTSVKFIKANKKLPENIAELAQFIKKNEIQSIDLNEFENIRYTKLNSEKVEMFFTLKVMPGIECKQILNATLITEATKDRNQAEK